MKKIIVCLMLLLLIGLSACTKNKDISIIIPSGTPSLGLANFINNTNNEKVDIVLGSDPLVAAFTSANYDIIVAPVNLGLKFYNTIEDFQYCLYKPIVGGNYYVLSTKAINSIKDLDGEDITVFGANSTPDVMFRSILSYYKINTNINYVDDVTTANSMFLSKNASTIITAEPSATKIFGNKSYYSISLQKVWYDMSDEEYAVPQAGIFVKKSLKENSQITTILEKMDASLYLADSDPSKLANDAILVDEALAKIGVEKLIEAIPKCNLMSKPVNKQAIEYYFNKIIDLGLGKSIGNKLPDEEFYY